MKLKTFQSLISQLDKLTFLLPDGESVPPHFHVTEVGRSHYNFIDCGGKLREETKVNFQLWSADDEDHRLAGSKLANIIDLAIERLDLENAEIEVEYQGKTIEKYSLGFRESENDIEFLLQPTLTDCLAKDACGIPDSKPKVRLSDIQTTNACAPGSGCC